jgi:hypothetical protein
MPAVAVTATVIASREDFMKIGELIEFIRWPLKNRVQLDDIKKISDLRKLRKLAENGRDEYIRLEAARHLRDTSLLMHFARKAADENVRLEAALAIGDQSALTALALKESSVQTGSEAVASIENKLLLRRVARSAKQDQIRLTAALRLKDSRLLKQVAQSASDMHVRWQIALQLNDLHLFSDIALSKTCSDSLRSKAGRALTGCLDQLQCQTNDSALLAFMQISTHLPFKLEAFLRLSSAQVRAETLRHLARQDFQNVPAQLITCFFSKISLCGWSLNDNLQRQNCALCFGKKKLPISISSPDTRQARKQPSTCPRCHGRGWIQHRVVACKNSSENEFIFRLPLEHV